MKLSDFVIAETKSMAHFQTLITQRKAGSFWKDTIVATLPELLKKVIDNGTVFVDNVDPKCLCLAYAFPEDIGFLGACKYSDLRNKTQVKIVETVKGFEMQLECDWTVPTNAAHVIIGNEPVGDQTNFCIFSFCPGLPLPKSDQLLLKEGKHDKHGTVKFIRKEGAK